MDHAIPWSEIGNWSHWKQNMYKNLSHRFYLQFQVTSSSSVLTKVTWGTEGKSDILLPERAALSSRLTITSFQYSGYLWLFWGIWKKLLTPLRVTVSKWMSLELEMSHKTELRIIQANGSLTCSIWSIWSVVTEFQGGTGVVLYFHKFIQLH